MNTRQTLMQSLILLARFREENISKETNQEIDILVKKVKKLFLITAKENINVQAMAEFEKIKTTLERFNKAFG